MKKITKITAIATLAITLFTSTASAVKMYSPDGRTASVMEQDVAAWKAKGWSTKNYKTMYAADGRSEKVLLTDVAAWKKVGWYEVPVTTVYAADGRSEIIAKSDVEAWKKVGWSEKNNNNKMSDDTYKKLKSFLIGKKNSSPSTRFCVGYVNGDNIPDIFLAEGDSHASGVEIYLSNSNGVEKIITEDGFESFGQWGSDVEYLPYKGKIKSFYMQRGEESNIFYNLKENIAYKLCKLSLLNLEETTYYINDVEVSESKYNKKLNEVYNNFVKMPAYEDLYEITEETINLVFNGKSNEKNNKKVTVYAPDGRTAEIKKSDVEAWKKVGWYEVPVTVMYSSINGSTMIVANSEIEAYRKVGWQQFHEHFYGKSYKYINNYFGGLKYSFYFAGGDFYNPGSSEIYFGFPCAYPASSSSYKCSGLYIPISMIHTDLMKYADNNGNISKRAFDKHIGITTRLVYDDFESQSYYILYKKNGLDFFIDCNYDGSFNVNNAYCDINQAG